MTKAARLRTLTAIIAAGLLAACSGDDGTTVTRSTDATPRTTGSTAGDRGSTTTEPEQEAEEDESTPTTSKFGDTIDLSDAPPIVIGDSRGVYYFADLLKPPAERAVIDGTRGSNYVISPDGTTVAVSLPGDAVRPARIDLVSIETGKAVQSFDVDADTVSLSSWAPDSTAIAGSTTDAGYAAYRIDGTVQTLTNPVGDVLWARGASTSIVDCSNCSGDQQVETDNTPVVIAQPSPDGTYIAGTWNPDSGTVDQFEGDWGLSADAERCTTTTIVRGRVGGNAAVALYHLERRTIHPIPEPVYGTCPVPSLDGKSSAFALEDGGTAVVDASGKVTTVARQGVPLAWSKDGKTVVVQGNGTFLVAADGSGGREASVSLTSLCPISDSGKVLARTTEELVVYDIGTDSAVSVGDLSTGDRCSVSADGTWVASSTTLVDLTKGASTNLRRTLTDGTTLRGDIVFIEPRSTARFTRA